jgi:hypothetical protein
LRSSIAEVAWVGDQRGLVRLRKENVIEQFYYGHLPPRLPKATVYLELTNRVVVMLPPLALFQVNHKTIVALFFTLAIGWRRGVGRN